MKLTSLLIIALLLGASACSSKKKQAATEGQGTDQIASFGEDADFIIESDSQDLLAVESSPEGEAIDPMVQEQFVTPILEEEGSMMASSGEVGNYTVQSGDTFMLIAFKLYGDYRKWKSVADLNPGVSSAQLRVGDSLKYDVPAEPFVWNPKGNPHLIQSGETLGTISSAKYGTANRWKDIYTNNQPMIKDPNMIFAGFTLYWISDRDIASE